MIVVHHLEKSRSQRVLWLLEELGVAYEVRRYPRDPKTMLAPPELRAIHPLGKSPVITDGDVTVAESGAIIEYLIERHGAGNFAPARGTPERLRYTYWLHYAEGSVMPPLLLKLVVARLKSAPAPFFVRPIVKGIAAKLSAGFVDPQLRLHADFMEAELGKSTWFAGAEPTGADVQMSFPVEAIVARGDGTPRPNLERFLDQVHQRPAYRRAFERGGPFEILR